MSDFKALLLPASELLRPTLVPVSADLSQLERYVQGLPRRARYDYDSAIYHNDQALYLRMARNERATTYVLEQSEAARQGVFRNDTRASWWLPGPVVIVGEIDHGSGDIEIVDVPARLIEAFGVEQSRGAEPG
jgi:hypothetical protein